MDAATRGLISQTINNIFETQDFLETVDWILESDSQIKSREDLALGYFLGAISDISHNYVRERLKNYKSWKIADKHLQKLVGKEEARKATEANQKAIRELRSKGGRQLKIEVTEKETEEIRNMLIPMFASFRDKIRKEEALRKANKRK